MPPKKTANASPDGDGAALAVTALCHLIMSCDDFKADNAKLAPILGIAQAKNVPRKINSIINPHGFEFKNAKILHSSAGHGQGGDGNAEAGSGGANTGGGGAGSGSAGDMHKKEPKGGQGRASKKRKTAPSEDETV